MKKRILLALLASLCAWPAYAALKPGDSAPTFTAPATLAGKQFTFSMRNALKKGPVVLYFYPSAFTKGCDIEAHTFAQNADKFAALHTTIIGVSADSIARLNDFSSDPNYCAGKFPVASDASHKIATSYDLTVTPGRSGMTDVRGVVIGHDFIERTTFVIGQDGKIIATLSSKQDGLTPDAHVDKSLAIVENAQK